MSFYRWFRTRRRQDSVVRAPPPVRVIRAGGTPTPPITAPPITSGLGDVGRLGALGLLGDVELHALARAEALVAVHLDVGVVDEDVLAAVIGGDEAKALFI